MASDRTTTATDMSNAFVDATYKQTAVVAAAIAGSLPMYVLVVEVLMRSATTAEPPGTFGTLRVALFVAAGVVIFLTTIIKGILLRNVPADPRERLARLRSATMVALALSEVPAVCGLVLAIVGRARNDFYMLLVISAYMMVRHFPRRGAWDEYLRRGSSPGVR